MLLSRMHKYPALIGKRDESAGMKDRKRVKRGLVNSSINQTNYIYVPVDHKIINNGIKKRCIHNLKAD